MTRARDVSNLLGTSGTNGQVLTIDTANTSGYAFENPAQYAAGKNFIINGGMDAWQRNTSFPVTVSGQVLYSADRWTCYAGNTGTISQDTTLVPTGFQASLKFTSNIASSGMDFYQLIETQNVVPLQGKTVTYSAYVAGTTGKVPSLNAYYSTTTDDYVYLHSGVLMGTQSTSTGLSSTTFQRVSVTFTVPATAKTIRLGMSSGSLNNGEFINWTGVQLEVGSVATPFSRAGGTIQGELALCQRYYEHNYPAGYYPGSDIHSVLDTGQSLFATVATGGTAGSNRARSSAWSYKVTKRTTPSNRSWDLLGNLSKYTAGDANGSQLTSNNSFDTYGTAQSTNTTSIAFETVAASSSHIYAMVMWEASAEL